MIDGFLLKRKALKSLHNKRFRTLPLPRMPAAGLEPARGCPRQILSLMRLPFRHAGLLMQRKYCSTSGRIWQAFFAEN